MMVTFVIPVEGQSSARTEDWGVESVPRVGELVRLENGPYYRVKDVAHYLQTDDRKKPVHSIEVTLGR